MKTAIVYLFTSITIALIMAFARRHENKSEGNSNLFKYNPVLVRAVFGVSFLPTILAIVIYIYAGRDAKEASKDVVVIVGLMFSVVMFYLYLYFESYVLVVNDDGIIIENRVGSKYLPFDVVKKIIFYSPSGHGGTLAMYGIKGKKLVEFSETIQGIDRLVELIDERATHFNIEIQFRNKLF